MSLYCFLCVGVTEELIFRGFILPKTQELSNRKVINHCSN
ncbi:CPBP family intramembrane glutamic endopeptidase [Anaerotignum propionicum]